MYPQNNAEKTNCSSLP